MVSVLCVCCVCEIEGINAVVCGGMENVQREIAFMQRFEHENVVKLIEVIHTDDGEKMYMVMEYVGGGSLQRIMDRNERPLPDSLVHR